MMSVPDPHATAAEGRRVAVVLLNLGGPDKPESIKPFLLNLFSDPAILRVPGFIRPLLARIITRARLKPATENYMILGGGSPLLQLTLAQAEALEASLSDLDARCFVAMRYWHPFSDEAVQQVKAYAPDEVLLVPLYPQYSTTTTGSSLSAWREAAVRGGLVVKTTALCCYHADAGFTAAAAAGVARTYADARASLPPEVGLRVLFSAHGLPESIVKAGDPYQHQVERTVGAVMRAWGAPDIDHQVCYQSRATPQKWIDPSTELAIEQAAHDKTAILVVPIAFVSEHSETLVELDVEYRDLAEKLGVPGYFRAPAQNSDPGFIAALAELCRRTLERGPGLCSFRGPRTCYAPHTDCPHARAGAKPPADSPAVTAPAPALQTA